MCASQHVFARVRLCVCRYSDQLIRLDARSQQKLGLDSFT